MHIYITKKARDLWFVAFCSLYRPPTPQTTRRFWNPPGGRTPHEENHWYLLMQYGNYKNYHCTPQWTNVICLWIGSLWLLIFCVRLWSQTQYSAASVHGELQFSKVTKDGSCNDLVILVISVGDRSEAAAAAATVSCHHNTKYANMQPFLVRNR